MAGGAAQGEGPEFKSQYCKKKSKRTTQLPSFQHSCITGMKTNTQLKGTELKNQKYSTRQPKHCF
jgi:hypothetical protein